MNYNILIIDDDSDRYNYIKDALIKPEIMPKKRKPYFINSKIVEPENHIHTINSYAEANKLVELYFYIFKTIEENNVDIVFLDMWLKENENKKTTSKQDEDNGTTGEKLINMLLSNGIHKNLPIIAYSRNIKDDSQFYEPKKFLGKSVRFIPMDSVSNASHAKGAIYGIISEETFSALIEEYQSRGLDYNLAILCALDKEMEPIKNILNLDAKDLKSSDGKRFKSTYLEYCSDIDEKYRILKVVYKSAGEAGELTAQSIAQSMIHDFKPQYIAMTGIAGGFKDNVSLGDVIIVRHSFNWQQGKHEKNKFLQRAEPFVIDKSLKLTIKEDFLENVKDGKFSVESLVNEFDKIDDINALKEKEEIDKFKIRFGPFATGSSVVASKKKEKTILELHDKTSGLDMEIYAVYKAAYESNVDTKAVAIKGIVDYIDENKGDDWHDFASYASAQILYKLFTEYADIR